MPSQPSRLSASSDFSSSNARSRIEDTAKGVAQDKIVTAAKSNGGVISSADEQAGVAPRLGVVTVVGSGYVGTTTAALLTALGIKTFAVDIDEEKVEKLKNGKAPFYEVGLDNLVAYGIDNDNLLPTSSYEESIPHASIVISAVGTPENADGSPDLRYVYSALESIAKYATGPIIYVQKSTVPVGTGRAIIAKYAELSDKPFSYVSAPEFLREGTAVVDSIEPDRIVVGGDDADSKHIITTIFRDISSRRDEIADIADQPIQNLPEPIAFNMSIESAELTKVTANAFLALKISFANSIAKLADATNADVAEVMDAVGSDKRIGRAFLNAGRGYGGGCFPKDVKGLISSAKANNVSMNIMTAASDLNESMPAYIVHQIADVLDGLESKNIAVLGLAFKAGTSDVRKSPGIKIANLLQQAESKVSAYDPQAHSEALADLNDGIALSDSAQLAINNADAIVVATEWPEFKDIDYSQTTAKLLFDAMNLLDSSMIVRNGLEYRGVGRKA